MEYIRDRIENLNNTEENLDRFRKELVNIFVTHFRDNGMSSNIIFMDPKIILLEICTRLYQLLVGVEVDCFEYEGNAERGNKQDRESHSEALGIVVHQK